MGVPVVPGHTLTYYASGAMFALTQILQAVHLKQPCTVIDCNLSLSLAYTSQPVLLDAHLNHRVEKGLRFS